MTQFSPYFYRHNVAPPRRRPATEADQKIFDAGPTPTREAGAYLKYVMQRQDSLPNATAFLHVDVHVHNPMWLRWLACLRPGLGLDDLVSLSPTVAPLRPNKHSPTRNKLLGFLGNATSPPRRERGLIPSLLGLRSAAPPRGAPACCFLWVQPRAAIERLPLEGVRAAWRSLNGEDNSELPPKLSPWDFEFYFHELYDPPEASLHAERQGRWRDPCVAFQCEQPACSAKYIRYLERGSISAPLKSGHSRKVADRSLLQWEEDVCGVTRNAFPEAMGLTSVREEKELKCQIAGRPFQLCDQLRPRPDAGLDASFSRLLPSYAAHVVSECKPDSAGPSLCHMNALQPHDRYRFSQASAKTAVRSDSCVPMRCWLSCCALCAARPWCVSWEWNIDTEKCALSEAVASPRRADVEEGGAGKFDTVVGSVQPLLPAKEQAYEWAVS